MNAEYQSETGSTIVEAVQRINLIGQLTHRYAAQVRKRLLALITAEKPCLVLDMSGVDKVDIAGLSILLSVRTAVLQHNGEVVLLQPSCSVVEMIKLIRLHYIFSIYMDENAASNYCRQHVITALQRQSSHEP